MRICSVEIITVQLWHEVETSITCLYFSCTDTTLTTAVATMDGVQIQKVQELQKHKLVESCEERGPHEPDELVTSTTTRTHTTVSSEEETGPHKPDELVT